MAYHNTEVQYDPTVGLKAADVPLNLFPASVSAVGASRALTAADNGQTLDCTTTVTLTVPISLPRGFSCRVITSGTTSIARSGAATINGAGTTLTRLASTSGNRIVEIQNTSVVDAYSVTGA